jgi:hypothetical protein
MKYVWLLASIGFVWLDVLWMVYTRQMASFNVTVFFLCLFVYGLICNRIGRRRRSESKQGESDDRR